MFIRLYQSVTLFAHITIRHGIKHSACILYNQQLDKNRRDTRPMGPRNLGRDSLACMPEYVYKVRH